MTTLRSKGRADQFVGPLRDLTAFTTHGSLAGRPGRANGSGRLPREHHDSLYGPNVDYVVTSYATPIAWHDSVTGWHVPDVRYSVTTSQQQGKIRTALAYLT